MDVLIIGGGGREHAIALTVKKNVTVQNIYIAPGNGALPRSVLMWTLRRTILNPFYNLL